MILDLAKIFGLNFRVSFANCSDRTYLSEQDRDSRERAPITERRSEQLRGQKYRERFCRERRADGETRPCGAFLRPVVFAIPTDDINPIDRTRSRYMTDDAGRRDLGTGQCNDSTTNHGQSAAVDSET